MAAKLALESALTLNTGYKLPILGLGVYQNIDKCYTACMAAFKHGYRHVDSAVMYQNEAEVGRAVVDSGLKREDVFITTKVSSRYHGYDKVTAKIDESLKKFGFDYIDLYLLHDPLSGKTKRLQSWEALIDGKKAGKIRSIGVSNYGVKHLEEIKEAGLETPSVNQIELHPFCQQRQIVKYCEENGIVIEAYCPIIRGDFSNPIFKKIGDKYGKSEAQVLIRWSLQKGYSPLPKSENPERISANGAVYDFELSSEDISALDTLDKGNRGSISWNPVNAD